MQSLVWQQDGAGPHFERNIRAFADEEFLALVDRCGSVEWS
jgi:hypothetical protein